MQCTVLIVDDDESVALLLQKVVEKVSMTGEVARSVARAKEMIDLDQFQILLCDFTLPDGDGNEVMEHFRTKFSSALRVGISGQHTNPFEPDNAIILIRKPFQTFHLLHEALEIGRSMSESVKTAQAHP